MPSFVVITMPPKAYSKDKILAKAASASAANDSAEFRQGVLPETVVEGEHAVGFEFVFEYETDIPRLDGIPVKVKTFKSIPVVLVDSGVALGELRRPNRI